eukprot:11667-Amphidinium_carterae.1
MAIFSLVGQHTIVKWIERRMQKSDRINLIDALDVCILEGEGLQLAVVRMLGIHLTYVFSFSPLPAGVIQGMAAIDMA